MGNTFYLAFEPELMIWLQSHMGKFAETLAVIFTAFGEELLLIAVMGYIYWCIDKKLGYHIGLTMVCGLVFNPMIKNIFLRRRPYFDHGEIKCLRPVENSADLYDAVAQGYSFPSGHSTDAVTIYTSLGFYKRKRFFRIIGILMPFFIGISRICLGVHYPTDVFFGWLLGLMIIILLEGLKKRMARNELFLLLMIVGTSGFFYCTSDDYYTAYGIMAGFFSAVLFEESYVDFQPVKSMHKQFIRLFMGIVIFFLLETILKLPFSSEFLHCGSFLSHVVRVVRYGLSVFVSFGIYPAAFKRLNL